MLAPERIRFLQSIVDDEDADVEAKIARLAEVRSAPELQYLARYYNWDDGFALPQAIAEHPLCDLGVARTLFDLAQGLAWLSGDAGAGPHNAEWTAFCQMLADRISRGSYAVGQASFKSDLGRVALYRYRKQGVPEVFLVDVVGSEPEERP